jgi:NAD-dependent deacetylase
MHLSRTSVALQKAAELIKNAHSAVALTGAGSSTPSGISDFRSSGSGLWTRFSPMEVASLTSFRKDPQRFYEWLRPYAKQMLIAEPNPAHFALAHLEQKNYLQTIITQNIDGLHQRAGSENVLQVHGTLNTLTCIRCYQQVSAKDYTELYIHEGKVPYCVQCGNVLKPDIVLFEEQLPVDIWLKARRTAQNCDLMIVAGTSLVVSPAAQLPEYAKKYGARIIIVNKSLTYMDELADVVVHGDVADILPEILVKTLND